MITLVFEGKGATTAQYDEACRLANVSQANPPDGLIFHSAAPTEDGILVVDVWESEEKFRAFGERLVPAMQQAGLGHIQPRVYPTHYVMGSGKIPVAT